MAAPNLSPEPPSTVIVVEPDILARMVIADYLRGCAYKVIEASLAEEALTVLRADIKVDVVLSEVKGIGALDGFSLAKQIRETFPASRKTFWVGSTYFASVGDRQNYLQICRNDSRSSRLRRK